MQLKQPPFVSGTFSGPSLLLPNNDYTGRRLWLVCFLIVLEPWP